MFELFGFAFAWFVMVSIYLIAAIVRIDDLQKRLDYLEKYVRKIAEK